MKSIIEDIFELRKEKLMKMLKAIDPNQPVKLLTHAGAVDINSVRTSFIAAYSVTNQMQNIIEQSKMNQQNAANE